MRPLALALILIALPAGGAEYNARVVKIDDGDTVTVRKDDNTQEKVRLASIDAPESDQPYGTEAKDTLANLVFNQPVRVEVVDADHDGQMLGTVWVDNLKRVGTVWVVHLNANAEMVRQGYAWVYRKYSQDHALLRLEAEARDARRGLWADPEPVPPWEWRRQ